MRWSGSEGGRTVGLSGNCANLSANVMLVGDQAQISARSIRIAMCQTRPPRYWPMPESASEVNGDPSAGNAPPLRAIEDANVDADQSPNPHVASR